MFGGMGEALGIFIGMVVVGVVLLNGMLWIKRGHFHADTIPEHFVIAVLVLTAAFLLGLGVYVDEGRVASVLVQVGAGIIAGAVVGVVILVLQRDQH